MPNRAPSQSTKANGIEFKYREWGDNRTKHALILLHGFGETSVIWDDMVSDLSREYRVIAIDQRGHGDSAHAADRNYSRTSQVEDLESIIDNFGLRTVTLIGHAMGGANAICYAAEHPDIVTALIVIESAPEVLRSGVETMRRVLASSNRFASLDEVVKVYGRYYPEATLEQLNRRAQAAVKVDDDGSYTWNFDPVFLDPTQRPPEPDPGQRRMVNLWDCVERVLCPTMIVRGSETDMLTPEAIQRLHRRIPGSRVSLIEGAGHSVSTDQPAALSQHIREFLQNLSKGPGQ